MSPVGQDSESTVAYDATRETTGPCAAAPWPVPAADRTGEVIAGRYRLLSRLGGGASAYVWLAHDDRLDRDVAIKILRDAAAHGTTERERLHREARALARLDHPRITAVFDLIEVPDSAGELIPALVTELLTGEDLAVRLKRGTLDLAQTLTVCAQLADALEAAHRAGIVHRDVKPANVKLTRAGVKLFDFGIARTAADSELTEGSAIGTPACMAPEQWLGHRAEAAADVYALGCLLHWCLAGQPPFPDQVLPALAMAHLQREPAPLPDRGQDPEIDALYLACLAKEPGDRPAIGRLAAVLARAAQQGPATDVKDAKNPPAPGDRRRPAAGLRAAVVGAVCLLVGGAVAIPLAASLTDSVGSPAPRSAQSSTQSAAAPVRTGTAASGASAAPSSAAAGAPAGASDAQSKPSVAGPPSGPADHTHTPPGRGKKKG